MLRVGHHCGLCNRLDVITTGYILAKMRGEEGVEIIWPLNGHMPVRFHDLFTDLPYGRVVERELAPEILADYEMACNKLPMDYRDSSLYKEMLGRVLSNTVQEVYSTVAGFEADHFCSTQECLRPVGVHIRRSECRSDISYHISLYAQPLRYYEAIMRGFSEDTRFFVSTDSEEAFGWLYRRFGNRVFQRSKLHNNRRDIGGVQEGLVDMLLLSRCRAVIGTFGSSFSHIAALAGDRPLLRVKTNLHVPPGWPAFNSLYWIWSYRHFVMESTFWKRWLYYSVLPVASSLKHSLPFWRRPNGPS